MVICFDLFFDESGNFEELPLIHLTLDEEKPTFKLDGTREEIRATLDVLGSYEGSVRPLNRPFASYMANGS